ncbi:hypothetical protein Slin15195_G029320 [Septoria linicola]|uniref:DUF7719 domain-containing protein n=1 Tax=Septoria linicola TaxID=215465 RepID=A0A9Q9AME0_9PEZI|nr:hypothetical protein Slin14017_G028350 [Septoria linicola]USW49613.1 hypothetical protein Slin15195_G029320 [Septoria linicola]
MAEEEKPRNRKERRAAAKESGKPVEAPTKMPKMKMTTPDYDARPAKGTTLLDIYEEKKDLLSKGQPFDDKYADGLPRGESGNILDVGLGDNEPIGPFGNAVFWSVCLAMLHFTLDVLTYNQYAQDIIWPAIFKRSGTILPILFLAIYIMKSELAYKLGILRQVLFLGVAIAAGCYLIHAGNAYGYFAVMKQAPPLGTLWVYSVIELDLWFAVASLAFNAGFMLWNGYTVF